MAETTPAQARFGHAVADYAVELARRAEARSVELFHHRHDRTDDALDGLAPRLKGVRLEVSIAAEGSVLDL
jgi:phosphoribosyl 1,2-cyclic phosphodiesterase